VPVFFFFWVFDVPALLVLGFWFVEQLVSGAAAITQASQVTGGVAFWAHSRGAHGAAGRAVCGDATGRAGGGASARAVQGRGALAYWTAGALVAWLLEASTARGTR